MYGTREQFEYLECAACGSLSIADVPADLARHYPDTYYSFGATPLRSRHGPLTRRLAVFALLNVPGLGKRLPAQFSRWRGLAEAGAEPSTRILDVGCGDGALLRTLKQNGFTDLHGVDPFIAHGTAEPGLTITKGGLADLAGPYDFILLSHTLEHMPDPPDALREVARLCAAGGHASSIGRGRS
jgi:SAM-dependent methyltransferase